MSPQRIQRQRTKGWRLTAGAVYVGRPSRWANPFRARQTSFAEVSAAMGTVAADLLDPWSVYRGGRRLDVNAPTQTVAAAVAVLLHREHVITSGIDLTPLRGHDLVCWCPLDQPCHADVLLDLANREGA